jgi:hypothetical protein
MMGAAPFMQQVTRTCLVSFVVLGLALGRPAAYAAPLDVGCNVTELINAITTANGTSEPDNINLASGCTYLLTTVNNQGLNGLPAITSVLTITGNSATIARSNAVGTPSFRIFTIDMTPVIWSSRHVRVLV